jgi:hypothetical protein
MLRREDRRCGPALLLLPALDRLLRRLLRLRLSLLRHCSPPSQDKWRYQNSAVANRRALHSDYTSTTEKTLTPLNGVCMRRAKRAFASAHATQAAQSITRAKMFARNPRTDVAHPRKIQMAPAFARDDERRSAALQVRCAIACHGARSPQTQALCRFCPVAKKFSTACLRTRCQAAQPSKNDRIRGE